MELGHEIHKVRFDSVFIVLCYRNTDDLRLFIKSASKLSTRYKILVVNSYYDDETQSSFKNIANQNDCDFINVPNKGYGAGNNRGIEYALSKYEFDYLVVCNPDIEFLSFPISEVSNMTDCIIAPVIKTLTGKAQNPYINHSNRLVEWIEYWGYKTKFKPLLYTGFAINKLFRESSNIIHNILKTRRRKIYACHGSCVIFGKEAIRKLGIPYDENMFLFCEEFHLAKLAKEKDIKTYMIPELRVLHKEDGSVSFISSGMWDIQGKSFIYYYRKWYKNR